MKHLDQTARGVRLVLLLGLLPGLLLAQNPACGTTVYSDVVLTDQMTCTLEQLASAGTPAAITVGADGITIDLQNFELRCTGTPFYGDCQDHPVPEPVNQTAVAINTNGHSNVVIKGPGTIWGFDRTIVVNGGNRVTIQDLKVTGPGEDQPQTPYVTTGPHTTGISVANVSCPGAIIVDGNVVEKHRYGIKIEDASCVKVQGNDVRLNRYISGESHGILVVNSSRNTITNNHVNENGLNIGLDGGLTLVGLGTTDNRIAQNTLQRNCGDALSARDGAYGNAMGNNSARDNPLYDQYGDSNSGGRCFNAPNPRVNYDMAERTSLISNSWRKNNDCDTQNELIPAGVCTPQ